MKGIISFAAVLLLAAGCASNGDSSRRAANTDASHGVNSSFSTPTDDVFRRQRAGSSIAVHVAPDTGTTNAAPDIDHAEQQGSDQNHVPVPQRLDPISAPEGAASGSPVLSSSSVGGKSNMDRNLTTKVRNQLKNIGAVQTRAVGENISSETLQRIQVDAHRGVVTLRGAVASESERLAIVERVQQIEGVVAVKNELQVLGDSVGSGQQNQTGRSGGR
ncbi:MAG: BON domain-containing protein [Verrucomicrobiota bacterium]|nr:BON domain-containing protein [Verrucomicrobiota bacterium]